MFHIYMTLNKYSVSVSVSLKTMAEYAYICCHVYKVIVVLHIYVKRLGIRLIGHPANRNYI